MPAGPALREIKNLFCFANFATSWLYLAQKGESDVTSIYEKNAKKIDKAITKLVEKVLEMD